MLLLELIKEIKLGVEEDNDEIEIYKNKKKKKFDINIKTSSFCQQFKASIKRPVLIPDTSSFVAGAIPLMK